MSDTMCPKCLNYLTRDQHDCMECVQGWAFLNALDGTRISPLLLARALEYHPAWFAA